MVLHPKKMLVERKIQTGIRNAPASQIAGDSEHVGGEGTFRRIVRFRIGDQRHEHFLRDLFRRRAVATHMQYKPIDRSLVSFVHCGKRLQIAKGNEQAFAAVYERYQGPVYRFVLHMSGNSATAEEVTQEVFMTLITNSKSYDPAKGSLAAYMFGIARNLTRRCIADSRLDLPLDEHLLGVGAHEQ